MSDIAVFLSPGDGIRLLVGKTKNPKTAKLGFAPEFCSLDPNVVKSYPPGFDDSCEYWEENLGSVRFFNPTNFGFELRPEEIWRARVEKITILPGSKRTRDGRRYVFVEVAVLDREETVEQEFDDVLGDWITRLRSGNATVSLKREPAECSVRQCKASVPVREFRHCLVEQYFGQRRDVVLSVEEIRVGGKLVRQKVIEGASREAFERIRKTKIRDLKHPFGRSIDPKVYRKMMSEAPEAFGNLPALPAGIEIPENILIY